MEPATAAAATTTAKNIRDLNWDTPYRYLASALAMATVVGGQWFNQRPFDALAHVAVFFRAEFVADWLRETDAWATNALPPVGGFFALLLALCVACNVSSWSVVADSRATSTAWLAVAALAYCPPVDWWSWLLLAIAVLAIQLARGDRSRPLSGLGDWAGMSFVNFVVAAAWLPLSAILWALTPARNGS